jgi:hypothetical protein
VRCTPYEEEKYDPFYGNGTRYDGSRIVCRREAADTHNGWANSPQRCYQEGEAVAVHGDRVPYDVGDDAGRN